MTPGPPMQRIESLDVLRGVAVLAILLVNVQSFAMIEAAYANPTAHMAFGAAGERIWRITATFFTLKFITIFSALFGAGVLMTLGREPDAGRERLHQRRMAWLLVFGMVHAYVFWRGDILAPYAIAGLVIAAARGLSVARLWALGLALIAVTSAWYPLVALLDAEAASVAAAWAPSPEEVAEEVALFRQSWLARFPQTAAMTVQMQVGVVMFFLPRILGVMMIGMALHRSGFFTLGWSGRSYAVSALVAAPVGVLASDWAARLHVETGFSYLGSTAGQFVNYWSSLVAAFGYAAVVMLACRWPRARVVRLPFAAAGRMALTNYLASTVICVAVFYGPPGLGRFGGVERPGQAGLVVAVWAVILTASPIWLRVAQYGPMEWVWRSLAHGRRQPLWRVERKDERKRQRDADSGG